MHPVLHLKPDWLMADQHKPLEQTFVEPSFGGFSTDDYRPKLEMVAYKDRLLGRFEKRKEAFRLYCLGSFVNEDMLEDKVIESPVSGGDAGRTDDIGSLQNFSLDLMLEGLEFGLIFL